MCQHGAVMDRSRSSFEVISHMKKGFTGKVEVNGKIAAAAPTEWLSVERALLAQPSRDRSIAAAVVLRMNMCA